MKSLSRAPPEHHRVILERIARAVNCQVEDVCDLRRFDGSRCQLGVPGRLYAGGAKTLGPPPDLAIPRPTGLQVH